MRFTFLIKGLETKTKHVAASFLCRHPKRRSLNVVFPFARTYGLLFVGWIQ